MQARVEEIPIGAAAATIRNGALVIDVREPDEYESGHVPSARSIPAATVSSQSRQLPKREPVYVICAAGNRSRAVAEHLAGQGFNALTVVGGTQGWIAAGHPVITGPHADRS